MGAVVKGGSESIAKFKGIPVNKYNELNKSMDIISSKFGELLEISPDNLDKLLQLMSAGKVKEAVAFLKRHTNITKDKNFLRQLQSLDEQLDEVAESVADNHRLANAVGNALDNDTIFKMRFAKAEGGFNGEDVAAELKIGYKDLRYRSPDHDETNFIRLLDELLALICGVKWHI